MLMSSMTSLIGCQRRMSRIFLLLLIRSLHHMKKAIDTPLGEIKMSADYILWDWFLQKILLTILPGKIATIQSWQQCCRFFVWQVIFLCFLLVLVLATPPGHARCRNAPRFSRFGASVSYSSSTCKARKCSPFSPMKFEKTVVSLQCPSWVTWLYHFLALTHWKFSDGFGVCSMTLGDKTVVLLRCPSRAIHLSQWFWALVSLPWNLKRCIVVGS